MQPVPGTITDRALEERLLGEEDARKQVERDAQSPLVSFTYNDVFRIVLISNVADTTGKAPVSGIELYKASVPAWDQARNFKSYRPELIVNLQFLRR